MSWRPDIMRVIQGEAAFALKSDEFLGDVNVLAQRDGDIANAVQRALKLTGGLAAVVMMPFFRVDERQGGLPGLPGNLALRIAVYENLRLNASGLNAEGVALGILDTLTLQVIPYGVQFLAEAIAPLGELEGNVGYVAELAVRLIEVRSQVASPSIDQAGGLITITDNDVAADVYYTTDGTYPGSGNAAATLYATPFAEPAAGTLIRARAFLTDCKPSQEANLTTT